ncbi:MAG: acyltransferase domain-containing protein, partial [Planctomycetaceae bacterium]|nr:acyltransferase domain-containing protein [Planctomycetaceae bacterium]
MSGDSLVIVAAECRVPGADSWAEFRDLLMNGATGYSDLPQERGDRSLYFHSEKGKPGRSYTTLGGVVPDPSRELQERFQTSGRAAFDPAHVHFADVVLRAWRQIGFEAGDPRAGRTGVYVGHSGGTRYGGDVSLAVQIEETLTFLHENEEFRRLPVQTRTAVINDVVAAVRRNRPQRGGNFPPRFEAYQAASLAASALRLQGPRIVLDAACASSLTALSLAMMAIQAGRIETAIVGGATYNSVDNLILFSQSQACTDRDSRPFDNAASGLVSSEGYVAIVVMREAAARGLGLVPLAEICGVGIASDGRGRSLWAPRKEGQILALKRAYDGVSRVSAKSIELLDIDYQEAHATSTQLGDATELETLHSLIAESSVWTRDRQRRLPIGSAKSNIGHTLEAAGLLGIVKVLTAMQEKALPPSLRFQNPNRGFAWDQSRIDVVTRRTPWPCRNASQPRTAAVSAFGIGGLNAHVVIRDREQSTTSDRDTVADSLARSLAPALADQDSIVIVGRGVVLPGARGITSFESLLKSAETAISEAPETRWRDRTGVQSTAQAAFATSPHCRAGYVRDFVFDGAKYRIPPRQAQQANPLQMMSLDAVSQALEECSASSARSQSVARSFQKLTDFDSAWPVGRDRTGVVIGTIFGGEFGDQLQADMRLPEIERELRSSLAAKLPDHSAQQITDCFRQTLLSNRPALLDETGSFTASTLASRIAKTFDLMGGACALDSDDASGLNAIVASMDQLLSGVVDLVVCGSGTRALNLSLFELMDHQGRLVRSGNPADIPEDLSRVIPGEGAVVLLLCRRSTAEQSGLRILGTIQPSTSQNSATVTYDAVDVNVVRKLGYLAGAHSLVRIVAETICDTSMEYSGSLVRTIAAAAQDGQFVSVDVGQGDVKATAVSGAQGESLKPEIAAIRRPNVHESSSNSNSHNSSYTLTSTARDHKTTMKNATNSLRLGAENAEAMLALVDSLLRSGDRIEFHGLVQRFGRDNSSTFELRDRLRVALPNIDTAERTLEDRLAGVAKALRSGRLNAVLEREQAVIWNVVDGASRIAWLYPGQGSHYSGMPSVLAESDAARLQLEQLDRAYESVGSKKLSEVLQGADVRIGDDIWWSQSWGLGVSACLTVALKDAGLTPDVCLGHSLGEFSAAFAACVVGVSQLAQLAIARAQAVMTQARFRGGLLSVRASSSEVDGVLRQDGLSVEISHLNSPRQTVVAGTQDAIAIAQKSFDARQIANISVPVPAPFHTQLMHNAERMFESLAGSVPLRPPTTAFLSATSVRYLSEPQEVRNSLTGQLTRPVLFLNAVERLLSDDVRLFVEVGPNDVLTRLTREIVGQRALCISADVPGLTFADRLALIHAAIECVTGGGRQSEAASIPAALQTRRRVTHAGRMENASGSGTAALFDVTRRARKAVTEPASAETSGVERSIPPEPRVVLPTSTVEVKAIDNTASGDPSAEMTAASTMSPDQIRQYLRDLIVELTGYDPEIIEAESDLEADLGIDSIKRAQIFGELASWLGITVRPNAIRFERVRTLNDAVALALELSRLSTTTPASQKVDADSRQETLSRHDEIEKAVRTPVETTKRSPAATSLPPVEAAPVEAAPVLPTSSELDGLLVAYVCDQTGYSPDVVDIDADLEADLGLDSIKLAQLIGEIRSQFSLQHLSREMVAQA